MDSRSNRGVVVVGLVACVAVAACTVRSIDPGSGSSGSSPVATKIADAPPPPATNAGSSSDETTTTTTADAGSKTGAGRADPQTPAKPAKAYCSGANPACDAACACGAGCAVCDTVPDPGIGVPAEFIVPACNKDGACGWACEPGRVTCSTNGLTVYCGLPMLSQITCSATYVTANDPTKRAFRTPTTCNVVFADDTVEKCDIPASGTSCTIFNDQPKSAAVKRVDIVLREDNAADYTRDDEFAPFYIGADPCTTVSVAATFTRK